MPQIETTYRSIGPASAAGTRYSSRRTGHGPEFLSQLIAERQQLIIERGRRQAPPLEVLRTYDAGGKLRVLRMPPGYRTDILA